MFILNKAKWGQNMPCRSPVVVTVFPRSLHLWHIITALFQVAILGALHCYPAVSVGLMGNVLQKPHLKGILCLLHLELDIRD